MLDRAWNIEVDDVVFHQCDESPEVRVAHQGWYAEVVVRVNVDNERSAVALRCCKPTRPRCQRPGVVHGLEPDRPADLLKRMPAHELAEGDAHVVENSCQLS